MKGRLPPYFRHHEYGIEPEDIVRMTLGCEPDTVQKRVVITPIWRSNLGLLEEARGTTIVPDRVWEVGHEGIAVTVIRSGVGAPNTGDVVLALGCTPCEVLIFTGSVGGLDARMSIGDFVVVEKSLSADGFTRYLSDHPGAPDRFLADTWPDPVLTATLTKAADSVCKHSGVALHSGAVVSVDSILAQFTRIDRWTAEKSLVGVEMETAATFEAARLSGIKAAALLQVSDVVPIRKTLFSGRTEKDHQRRHWTRRIALPDIVLNTLVQMSAS